jgi:hypothetical protein
MSILNRKHLTLIGTLLILVVLPILYINFGNYNLSSTLTSSEEKEYLQVIYSLGASMIIVLYYGFRWIIKKNKGKFFGVIILNLLGLFSLYLLFETISHNLFMEADFYYLIVYTEIVIVHLMYHLYSKTSIV